MCTSHNYRQLLKDMLEDWFVGNVCIKCSHKVTTDVGQIYHIGSTHQQIIELWDKRYNSEVVYYETKNEKLIPSEDENENSAGEETRQLKSI